MCDDDDRTYYTQLTDTDTISVKYIARRDKQISKLQQDAGAAAAADSPNVTLHGKCVLEGDSDLD